MTRDVTRELSCVTSPSVVLLLSYESIQSPAGILLLITLAVLQSIRYVNEYDGDVLG